MYDLLSPVHSTTIQQILIVWIDTCLKPGKHFVLWLNGHNGVSKHIILESKTIFVSARHTVFVGTRWDGTRTVILNVYQSHQCFGLLSKLQICNIYSFIHVVSTDEIALFKPTEWQRFVQTCHTSVFYTHSRLEIKSAFHTQWK